MCAMIESNASRAMADPLSNSLNGTDSLPLVNNMIGSNQPVTSIKSESNFSSDYSMTPSTDLNFSDFGIYPSTTYSDMLHENKWSESSTNSIEAPSKTTPVHSPAPLSSNPHTPVTQTSYNSFPFSPLMQSPKDSFDSNNTVEKMESVRLRSLLSIPKRTDGPSDDSNVAKNEHNILKGLLNPDEMASPSTDDKPANQSTPPSPANVRQVIQNLNDTSTSNNPSTNNNNMLLKVCYLNHYIIEIKISTNIIKL